MPRPKKDGAELADFASRLNSAINKSPKVPVAGKGKQTELARLMGVSQEAVRRWINGMSRPSTTAVEKLAEILDVDPAWLALGVSASGSKRKPTLNKAMEGAVYYVFGVLALFGERPAFTTHGGADLAVIVDNELRYYTVSLALPEGKTGYFAELPADVSPDVETLIVVPEQQSGEVRIVKAKYDDVVSCTEDHGGYRTLSLTMSGKTCKSGKAKLKVIDPRRLSA